MNLLNFKETAQRMGFKSRTYVYDQVEGGMLPPPVRFGERALRFPSAEIDAVIAARISGQSEAEIRALVERLTKRRAKDAAYLVQ